MSPPDGTSGAPPVGMPPGPGDGRRAGGPKEWLLSLATIVAVLLSLAAVEAGFRLHEPDYLYTVFGEETSTVYSETYGWDLRRGFRGVSFGDVQTINRLGYRGREHSQAREPGHRRVVMLGDSVAFGAGVKDEDTFTALLEARDPQLDVVNLSVGGYGTDQELIKLEREGLRYHPDVVILHFCLFSDFTDNALAYSLWDSRQPKPFFTWDGHSVVKHDDHVKLSPFRRLTQWLSDYSHLYNRLRGLLHLRPPPRERGVARARRNAVMRHLEPTADLTFRLIRRMNELALGAGARFLVMIHPDEAGFARSSRLLQAFCRHPLLQGIPVVDMGDRYRAAGLGFDQIAVDSVGHLTRLGHEVTVGVVESLLSGSVPPGFEYSASCGADPPS